MLYIVREPMRKFRDLAPLLFLLISTRLIGADTTVNPPPTSDPLSTASSSQLPYSPGIDLTSLDTTTNACDDFYQYACGGWIKNNPIPDNQARWSVTGKLIDETNIFLRGILERLGNLKDTSSEQRKLGAYYSSCMDEGLIEKIDSRAFLEEWNALDKFEKKRDLPELMARLKKHSLSSNLFFGFTSIQDLDNAKDVIPVIESGGLGLPDRDFYTSKNKSSQDILKKYEKHISHNFKMIGLPAKLAISEATIVIQMETALAKAMLSKVDQRNPANLAHKFEVAALNKITPSFDWTKYFEILELPKVKYVQVNEPVFIKAIEQQWKSRSFKEIKTYLRWQLLRERAPMLSERFATSDFEFYGKALNGVPQPLPRWKQCVQLADTQLGDLLGKEYIKTTFGPELKSRVQDMTKQVEFALKERIAGLDWMSDKTKKKALEKLEKVSLKIGYPDRWKDYASYNVDPNDFYGNVLRGNAFEVRRLLAKIGKPIDRGEWVIMNPQSVGAYYNPQMNDINFPAAILQAPFFDAKMDAAQHYGNTGAAIGHELVHGFDDIGRGFDADGNFKVWWDKSDSTKFNKKVQCLIDQYAKYNVVDGIKVNSKLTVGEDIADLGGTILAYMAWKSEIGPKSLPDIDGLSPDQRFFIGFAQWACGSHRPEAARVTALTSQHSPSKYRINGVVVNMPEFQKAFSCRPKQAMVEHEICKIW